LDICDVFQDTLVVVGVEDSVSAGIESCPGLAWRLFKTVFQALTELIESFWMGDKSHICHVRELSIPPKLCIILETCVKALADLGWLMYCS
jgi:hypothetical protein